MSDSWWVGNRRPLRITTVHVEPVGDELCVYDWKRNQVHTLNPTAASIWRLCDGKTPPSKMAAKLRALLQTPEADALVIAGLRQLDTARLLQDRTAPLDEELSRRQLVTRLGRAIALAPVIHSIVAPTPLDAQSAASFSLVYTGAVQLITVPAAVTRVTIAAYGAEGGGSYTSQAGGGAGGLVTAIVAVTPGEVLSVFVGGKGPNSVFNNFFTPIPGGFNGGGGSDGNGAGGGGASDVRRGSSRLVVAGGGGGSATQSNGAGGAGGGMTGASGMNGFSGGGGAGGSQGTGGAGGTAGINGVPGTAGSAGTGGLGGSTTVTRGMAGGGGGGGYFGGGGGGGGYHMNVFQILGSGGGGGGSSFADPAATGVTHTQGARLGDGLVVLTWS